jgi:hypothetical protein
VLGTFCGEEFKGVIGVTRANILVYSEIQVRDGV